ncbi:helix-turn-helix domain-containing protein [Neorhizobium sp. T6_25]|uniref:helix-turn-helix domain-containing protein n=1 Tax=Neorhizobium sp. T6_25 TaxID=2093833 RepID=UPI00197B337A
MRALGNERRELEDLGRMVRHARKERRLSQQTFADLAGVGRRFVSEFETAKRYSNSTRTCK